MSRFIQRATVLAVLWLVFAGTASAQVDRATLTGVVRDPSDAVVPKAKVTVTSLATGVASIATTTAEGTYLVVNLAPGQYLVQAEATGFQRYEQTVSVELGARSRLDVSLTVGSIGETVKVEGITPLMSSESAVLGTVVDQKRSGQAAARHPQLGRPAGDGAWRAERSLYRAGGRHLGGPHRWRQRARQSQPAEQLPARRRRQQQLLHQRAGADDADLASVGGCDRRVQGGDESVCGRVRLVARCGDYREHESRCQHVPRHRVRLFPRRPIRHEQLLCQGRESTEARQQSESVRRQFRRPDWPAGVLLCRLRRHAHRAGRAANGNGHDGRPAARRLHDGDSRSAHAAAVPEQHDPDESDRSGRRLDHGSRPVAQHHRRQQLHPPAERRGPVGPLSRLASTSRSAGRTTSSSATSAAIASGSSRAGLAACSTAHRHRHGARTTWIRTPSSPVGTR